MLWIEVYAQSVGNLFAIRRKICLNEMCVRVNLSRHAAVSEIEEIDHLLPSARVKVKVHPNRLFAKIWYYYRNLTHVAVLSFSYQPLYKHFKIIEPYLCAVFTQGDINGFP